MLCFIYKWLISRALDKQGSGGKLPVFVARHIRRCRTCREFHRLSESLAHRLVSDRSAFLRRSDRVDPLNEKIITAIVTTPAPSKQPQPVHPRVRLPIPVMAAAVVVLIVALGIITRLGTGNGPGTVESTAISIEDFDLSKISLPEIVGRVESPIETEMNNLKESIKSAAEFISSVVDVEVGAQ